MKTFTRHQRSIRATFTNFSVSTGSLLLLLSLCVVAFFRPALAQTDTRYQPQPYVELEHPTWSRDATIYQVNLRQFTEEGTFRAFERHLPRLKKLGVDILWLMPIHPIGEKNRKGKLGSYYSVKDYYGINPEHGDKQDFRHLVKAIHDQGMYVILDWVANHSAWDNPLVKQHPDWYIKDRSGNFQSTPWRDYDDIIDFDYASPALRKYMTDALVYWVKEFDIDGYRADVASFVPIEFWNNARAELDTIKPVFMLAESQDRDLHKHAFDMTYAWQLWDHLHNIAVNGASLAGLTEGYIAEHVSIWPPNGYRMNFVTNHDKNSWEGTLAKNFGPALDAAIVLTATLEGMPMLYSGQEAGLDRPLAFFDKDTINWRDHPHTQLYETLFSLKHNERALWNGKWGGVMERIRNTHEEQVLSFVREKQRSRVITVVNYSPEPASVTLHTNALTGQYRQVFSNQAVQIESSTEVTLSPWAYQIWVLQDGDADESRPTPDSL